MLGLLCSGQGTQHPDMFRLTADAPEAAVIFDAATDVLRSDPRAFVRSVEPQALFANRAAQILCVTQALAAAAMMGDALPRRCVIAGYSVGALSAWGVAGLVEPGTAISLAATRAELMDAASGPDDALAFVRGLSRPAIDTLAGAHGADIAIVNPNDSFILGGTRPRLLALVEAALAAGAARAGLLSVHVASHTQRLAAASAAFGQTLRGCEVHRPARTMTVMSALNGSAVTDPVQGAQALAREIGTMLHWADCLDAMIERGVTTFLELGPGRALAEMVGSRVSGVEARSVDDFKSRDGLLTWIRRRV